jgi:hypothetical protein
MGLPLAVLAFGDAGFGPMVALFTISNLMHFTLGAWIIDHHARFSRLLRNPMVWSTVAGFAFAILRPPLPDWIASAFKIAGDGLIPLMLIALGVRLIDIDWRDTRIGIVGGIVCPVTGLLAAAVLVHLLALNPLQAGLLYLFGALPPAVLNFMVAEQYRQEPGKVASIVLVGNVMSIVFIPVGLALALRA